MLRNIDHVVVVVRDLASASEDFRRAGFTVVPGGEHVGGATHNALVAFPDGTYFELIAFREPDRPQPHKWWPRLALGEGLTDYALGSDDLAADAARIRERGLVVEGPVEGGRLRPDGERLEWRTILLGRGVASDRGQSILPFIIEDVTPRERRVPGGAAAEHRLGLQRVAGLVLATSDLASAAASMEALLGPSGRRPVTWTSDDGEGVDFLIGEQWLRLLQPRGSRSPVAQHLDRFGEGPYEVVLAGERALPPFSGELLDGSLHGARIRIAR